MCWIFRGEAFLEAFAAGRVNRKPGSTTLYNKSVPESRLGRQLGKIVNSRNKINQQRRCVLTFPYSFLCFPCSISFSASFICFYFPVLLIAFSFIFLIFSFLLTVLSSCSPCLSNSTSIFLSPYFISHLPICPMLWQFLLLEKYFLWTRHYKLFFFFQRVIFKGLYQGCH